MGCHGARSWARTSSPRRKVHVQVVVLANMQDTELVEPVKPTARVEPAWAIRHQTFFWFATKPVPVRVTMEDTPTVTGEKRLPASEAVMLDGVPPTLADTVTVAGVVNAANVPPKSP